MRKRFSLRLIPAYDAASALAEAALCGKEGAEALIMRHACLLAKALYLGEERVFSCGMEAAKALPAGTLACWAEAYDRLCRSSEENFLRWQEEKDRLQEDEKGRLRWKVLRKFGVLPWEDRAKAMQDGDLLHCVLQLMLDAEEELERLCPKCKEDLLAGGCPVCGAVQYGQNPNFDEKRFEELKRHGLSQPHSPDSAPQG